MRAYINKFEVIIGLHESGFTEDFTFSGDKILWVQQKILIPPEDITLIEFYSFRSIAGNTMLIFGVIANYSCVKGILITHPKSCKNKPVINTELVKVNSIPSAPRYAVAR